MSDQPPTQGPEGESPEDPSDDSSWPQVDRRRVGGTFWGWIRQTARLWGFLAFIGLALIVFRTVILPFVLAILVAYVLAPVLRFLCQRVQIGGRKVPRFVWVIALYVVVLGMMGLFVTSFVPRLTHQFTKIVKETPDFWDNVRKRYVPAVSRWVETNLGTGFAVPETPKAEEGKAPPPPRLKVRPSKEGELELEVADLRVEVVRAEKGRWILRVPERQKKEKHEGLTESINNFLKRAVTQSETRTKQVMGLGQKLVVFLLNTITTFILVLMISAFLLLDTERILRWFRNLVPRTYFDDFDNVIVLIDKGLSGAIRGQLMICCINGVLTWIGLELIDVDYALLLALLAGVMSLIPIFGSILSSIPIVIIALASGSDGLDVLKGVLILAWIIGIHLLEANLLNPKIMGTAAKIHPVVVIFAVVAGERTYGAMGALLGVPLVSAVQAVFMYLRRKVRGEPEDPAQAPVETKA